MKSNTLRNYLKKYLVTPTALSQNDLARRCGIPIQTMSDFLSGKKENIDHEREHRLLAFVKPSVIDPETIAAKIRASLLDRRLSEDEIRVIGRKIAQEGSLPA